jgi:hypothetical protein
MSLETVLTAWTALDEAELGRPWTWRGGRMELRHALYRTVEDAQEALVRATAAPAGEARRILALAQRAFGELRGLLAGRPADWLDRAPGPGEWTLRETLRHVLVIERRYAIQTRYAVDRGDADPVRIPADRLRAAEDSDAGGDVAAALARLAAARAETERQLADLPPAALTRPTGWVHYDVDVRFRLHRFAAHLAEHTVQCEKTLAALGGRETEGRRIVRRAWALVGELEGLGARGELDALAGLLEERAASVAATLAGAPAAGGG